METSISMMIPLIPFHALSCWMRIERVQQASEHGLGSKAGPRQRFKFSNCELARWTHSILIQRYMYSITKWNWGDGDELLVSVPQTHSSWLWVFNSCVIPVYRAGSRAIVTSHCFQSRHSFHPCTAWSDQSLQEKQRECLILFTKFITWKSQFSWFINSIFFTYWT